MSALFRRQIALPQDHGLWVFIASPLLIGLFAGRSFGPASAVLVAAAMAAFLIRQPVTMAIKVWSGRRPRTDLAAAGFWTAAYAAVLGLAIAALITLGAGFILLLALSAPAAYWVGIGRYDPAGWLLWGLVWAQSAASIAYAYLRLEQRVWKRAPARGERFSAARGPIAFAGANLLASIALGPLAGAQPVWIFLPFALQFGETLWGTDHPAIGARPAAIGGRQLAVSTLFTALFIIATR